MNQATAIELTPPAQGAPSQRRRHLLPLPPAAPEAAQRAMCPALWTAGARRAGRMRLSLLQKQENAHDDSVWACAWAPGSNTLVGCCVDAGFGRSVGLHTGRWEVLAWVGNAWDGRNIQAPSSVGLERRRAAHPPLQARALMHCR